MIRIALLLLALTGTAMAKDGQIQAPKGSAAPVDEEEAFWSSPLAQDMMKNFDDFQAGRKTVEEMRDELDRKYGNDSTAGGPRTVPNAPIVRIK
jgi:hypothetical protein